MSIPLYRPFLSEKATEKVKEALESRWFGYGKNSMALEGLFTSRFGGFAVATNSCTSALYLAACAIFEREGDEVIVPAITFVSTGIAFLEAGFKVIIADVDENGLMDLSSVKALISKRTKAIVPVHLYGQKMDLRPFRELCNEKGITLVEDCAHRIGLKDEEKLGDYACFSFNTMKEVPSGEGGLLWGKDKGKEALVRAHAYVGLTENTFQRTSKIRHSNYVFSSNPGLKYLQNDIVAALTLAQFEDYEENLLKRKSIYERYKDVLSKKSYANLLNRNEKDSYLMNVFKIQKEKVEDFRAFLSARGIATSHHYPSLSSHPLFISPLPTPQAEKLQQEVVTLPCFIDMSEEELAYILNAIDEYGK